VLLLLLLLLLLPDCHPTHTIPSKQHLPDIANMVGKKSGRALLREEGEHLILHDKTGQACDDDATCDTLPPCAEQKLRLATHRLPAHPLPSLYAPG
jgi:hypothetical protein